LYQVLGLLRQAFLVFVNNLPWMGWNLFLAAVPLALSAWLFIAGRRRSALWWALAATWLAFLPNAPYILTDVIHLVERIRRGNLSIWVITLVLIPQYVLFLLAGFQAYVLSLLRLEGYLRCERFARWSLPIELGIHALSAVGIYLGRFLRLNTWDLVTQPDGVLNDLLRTLFGKQPMLVVAVTFGVLLVLYRLFRLLNLALAAYRQGDVSRTPSDSSSDVTGVAGP
jgi:uncharacterized membrane protein